MQFLECPVATYCVGLAASGGAVLLAGRAAKGKRYALPHSKMMIHQPYGQVGGQVSDIEIQAEDILSTREVLNEILAKHTGQPIERDRQGHRPRPLPDGRRGGRIRPRRRDPDPPREAEERQEIARKSASP